MRRIFASVVRARSKARRGFQKRLRFHVPRRRSADGERLTVELVLTRNLVGEVLAATDGGAIKKAGLNLQSFNPNSIVRWNSSVPAGGEREIRYTYKIYIRR